jgi:PAX-interacting protein 1
MSLFYAEQQLVECERQRQELEQLIEKERSERRTVNQGQGQGHEQQLEEYESQLVALVKERSENHSNKEMLIAEHQRQIAEQQDWFRMHFDRQQSDHQQQMIEIQRQLAEEQHNRQLAQQQFEEQRQQFEEQQIEDQQLIEEQRQQIEEQQLIEEQQRQQIEEQQLIEEQQRQQIEQQRQQIEEQKQQKSFNPYADYLNDDGDQKTIHELRGENATLRTNNNVAAGRIHEMEHQIDQLQIQLQRQVVVRPVPVPRPRPQLPTTASEQTKACRFHPMRCRSCDTCRENNAALAAPVGLIDAIRNAIDVRGLRG